MHTMDSDYRLAVQDSGRTVTAYLSIGTGIDTTAADDTVITCASMMPLSADAQLTDADYHTDDFAVYEGDGIPTEGTVIVPPEGPVSDMACERGLWSDALSGSDGSISVVITMTAPSYHTSALTIYTDGPDITAATAVFSTASGDVSVAMDCTRAGKACVHTEYTWDEIVVTVTKISAAYVHLRVSEVEYGDSVALTDSSLTDAMTLIREHDPMLASIPMDELDFDLINVNGDYDRYATGSHPDRVAVGNPVELTLTVSEDDDSWSVPCGRYFIASRQARGGAMCVTAYDVRWLLTQVTQSWSISADEDLYTTLQGLFSAIDVPCALDLSIASVTPVSDYVFDEGTTILDDLLQLAQAYGLYVGADRWGTVTVSMTAPGDSYGNVPVAGLYQWPNSEAVTIYNYIDVRWGDAETGYSHVTRDLRDDEKTARVIRSVSNPIITTEAMASALCARLVSAVYSEVMSAEWTGDPAMDPGDTVGVTEKWHTTAYTSCRLIKAETSYTGGFASETVRLVR